MFAQVIRIVPLGLVLASAACSVRETPAQERPAASRDSVPVALVDVARRPVVRPIVGTGRIAPDDELHQGFAFGGRVVQVLVDQGDHVKRGQLLAKLDRRAIDAQVRQARAASVKAERDLARVTGLHAENVLPEEAMQNASTGADVARAALDQARSARGNTRLYAATDGIVLARLVQSGEVVGPGEPVVIIAGEGGQAGPVVKLGLADREAARVRVGDPAQVRVRTLERPLGGRVRQIAPMADPRTGTIEIEVVLTEAVPAATPLPVGLVAAVEITPTQADDVWVVPMVALVEADGDRAQVFALDAEGVAHKHAVRVAFLLPDSAALREGLDGVEQIVGEGAAYLDEGTHTVRAPASAAAATPVQP